MPDVQKTRTTRKNPVDTLPGEPPLSPVYAEFIAVSDDIHNRFQKAIQMAHALATRNDELLSELHSFLPLLDQLVDKHIDGTEVDWHDVRKQLIAVAGRPVQWHKEQMRQADNNRTLRNESQ